MNDNEMVKALECCMNGHCEDDCPFSKTREHCFNLDSLTLDLINRLKAEIERLQEENKIKSQKRANIFELIENYDKGRIAGAKEFAERLLEMKYQSSDWSRGEHPYVVEADDIEDLLAEMESETDTNVGSKTEKGGDSDA